MGLINFLKSVVNPATDKPTGDGEGPHSRQPKRTSESVIELSLSQHEELWAQAIADVLDEEGVDATVEVVPDGASKGHTVAPSPESKSTSRKERSQKARDAPGLRRVGTELKRSKPE